MIRAPGVNAVLNGLAFGRQILRRRNAFEEAVSGRTDGDCNTGERPPGSFLDLRELSSPSLWLLACRRSHVQLSKALAGEHRKEVEELLAQYSELLRFSQVLDRAKALRPQLLLRRLSVEDTSWRTRISWLYTTLASRWYYQAVTTGLQKGLIKPGETKGIPSAVLLQVKNKEATEKLMEEVQKQQANYNMTLQRGLQGKGYLDLNEEDLIGLNNDMKSVWESHLGSAAVWRKTKYRVPIGSEPPVDHWSKTDEHSEVVDFWSGSGWASFAEKADQRAIDAAMAEPTGEKGSIFDHKEPETLALEAPKETIVEDSSDVRTVVVDGNPVKLDKLGPLVINTDGSIARINNWHEMTELEQQNTLRVLGKRNKQRLAKLREAAEASNS
eukprot:s1804_g10.t1